MRGKSTVRIIVNAFVVVLFMSISAWAQSADKKAQAQISCAKTTSAEIIAAIKTQFEADAEIKDQMRHINVSVKKRIVTLEGWLDGKEAIMRAVELAKATKCVKRVTSKLKENGGGSCGAGQRPCGDTCIDRRSECTIGN